MPILTTTDERFRSWLRSVAGGVPVRAERPNDDVAEPTITAYLLGLDPTAHVRGEPHRPAPVIVRMRYLVCADASEAAQALALLDTALDAALRTPVLDGGHRLDADLTPLPPEVWLALGVHQRPAFTVRVDAEYAFVPDVVPFVREPLRVVASTVRSLTGRLVGPGDIPLAGAEVTLAATGVADRTSSNGTFTFATVPSGPGPVHLAVRAKGRTFTANVDPNDDDPVVIRCALLEG